MAKLISPSIFLMASLALLVGGGALLLSPGTAAAAGSSCGRVVPLDEDGDGSADRNVIIQQPCELRGTVIKYLGDVLDQNGNLHWRHYRLIRHDYTATYQQEQDRLAREAERKEAERQAYLDRLARERANPPPAAAPVADDSHYRSALYQLKAVGWVAASRFMVSHPDYENGRPFFPYLYDPVRCQGRPEPYYQINDTAGQCSAPAAEITDLDEGHSVPGLTCEVSVDIEITPGPNGGFTAVDLDERGDPITVWIQSSDPRHPHHPAIPDGVVWDDNARNSPHHERGAFVFQCNS